MSAQIDCPICMDCIEISKNCVTTECGHSFHASCLMTSVAHNGFGCPYCRAKMAEEPEEDEETVYSDEEEEELDMFDESALRGFRFFWNILDGQEHDAEDLDDEEAEEAPEEDGEEEQEASNVPTPSFVAQKLQEQGVTYEQLVKMVLLQHEEYAEDEEAERLDNDTFGKVRIIVSNYNPDEPAVAPQPAPQSVSLPMPPPVPVVDFDAQPKIYSHRIMVHV
jgi:hypothetical protein